MARLKVIFQHATPQQQHCGGGRQLSVWMGCLCSCVCVCVCAEACFMCMFGEFCTTTPSFYGHPYCKQIYVIVFLQRGNPWTTNSCVCVNNSNLRHAAITAKQRKGPISLASRVEVDHTGGWQGSHPTCALLSKSLGVELSTPHTLYLSVRPTLSAKYRASVG